jgi:hypothetical protein
LAICDGIVRVNHLSRHAAPTSYEVVARLERGHEPRDVCGVVLKVGVEGDEHRVP